MSHLDICVLMAVWSMWIESAWGFDWHHGEVLVVPKSKLDIHDVEELAKKTDTKP